MDSFWEERGWVPSEQLVLAARGASSPEAALRRSPYAHFILAFGAMCDRPLDTIRAAIVDVLDACDVRARLPERTLLVLDLLRIPRVQITAAMRTKTFPAVLGATDKGAKLAAGALDEAVRLLEEQSRGVPGGPIRGLLATVTLAAAARIADNFALGVNISAHHVLEFADASIRRRENWPPLATHPHIEQWPRETGEALVDALQILTPTVLRSLA
jgi:hypothetical protein